MLALPASGKMAQLLVRLLSSVCSPVITLPVELADWPSEAEDSSSLSRLASLEAVLLLVLLAVPKMLSVLVPFWAAVAWSC